MVLVKKNTSRVRQITQGIAVIAAVGWVSWMLAEPRAAPPRSPPAPKVELPSLGHDFLTATPADIARELSRYIVPRGAMILVRDPLMPGLQTYILPRGSAWQISCGLGLSVTLGSAVSGAAENVGNDIELRLDTAMLDNSDCEKIGLKLGAALTAMVGFPSSPIHNP